MGKYVTPDILGGPTEVVDVQTVLGNGIIVVDDFAWQGYGSLPAETADKLRVVTSAYQRAMRGLGTSVVDAGRALVRAKELLAHGAWGEWLAVEAQLTEQQARSLMNIARKFGELPGDLKISSSALALLAAPGVPEEVRAAVIEEAQERPVTVAETKAKIVAAQADKVQWDAESRRMEAVEGVMQWLASLPDKMRTTALGNWKLRGNRTQLKAYLQGFSDDEISAAVAHCRQHQQRLLRERGLTPAVERRASPPSPERVGVSKPTARHAVSAAPVAEATNRNADWHYIEPAEQDILQDLLGGNGRRVRIPKAGELEFVAQSGTVVTLAAALEQGEVVLRWKVKL